MPVIGSTYVLITEEQYGVLQSFGIDTLISMFGSNTTEIDGVKYYYCLGSSLDFGVIGEDIYDEFFEAFGYNYSVRRYLDSGVWSDGL